MQDPAENINQAVWFYRDFRTFTGGHLKHAHYFEHVRNFSGFTGKICFSSQSEKLSEQRAQLWSGEPVARWAPVAGDILFLGGLDWNYLDQQKLTQLDLPRVNLIQHVRHAKPDSELDSFLSRKAIRICVSQEVADAIQSTGKVVGPVRVIPNGIDVDLPEAEQLEKHLNEKAKKNVLIVGYKNPGFSNQLAKVLDEKNIPYHLSLTMQDRTAFIKQLDGYEVIMCIPHKTEGFYLPALETMARARLLVTMDCIGNRGFCFSMRNCVLANYSVESALQKIHIALTFSSEKRRSVLNNAVETARAFSMQQEARKFQLLLQDISELW